MLLTAAVTFPLTNIGLFSGCVSLAGTARTEATNMDADRADGLSPIRIWMQTIEQDFRRVCKVKSWERFRLNYNDIVDFVLFQ